MKILIILLVALCRLPCALAQGSLTPPAAPAPIFKTLDQVEPRTAISNLPATINARGSYYMDRNLTMTGGTTGITINTNDVTLDLNGFTLASVGSTGDGIDLSGIRSNIVIRNGTLRNWGLSGVNLSSGHRCQVEDVFSAGNAANGILGGQGAIVLRCRAVKNGGAGIDLERGGFISQCDAFDNSTVGFEMGSRSAAANCVAMLNNSNGFRLAGGVMVKDCVASENQGRGIAVAPGGSFTEGVSILDCSVTSNRLDGIVVGAASLVRGNTCSRNGPSVPFVGAGIHVQGVQNRIEDNHCTKNDAGIEVDGTNNLVICNSASGNTAEFTIAAGNSVGAILVLTGTTFTNSNPWANFQF